MSLVRALNALDGESVVAEYLPLVGTDGRTAAVMALWRDAAPLLASVAQVQRDVVIVVLGAATVLAVILFLVFRAAQLRINRQQAQLLEATRRDPLTGLLNHGAVVASLALLVEGLRRESGSIGIARLIDCNAIEFCQGTIFVTRPGANECEKTPLPNILEYVALRQQRLPSIDCFHRLSSMAEQRFRPRQFLP